MGDGGEGQSCCCRGASTASNTETYGSTVWWKAPVRPLMHQSRITEVCIDEKGVSYELFVPGSQSLKKPVVEEAYLFDSGSTAFQKGNGIMELL